MISEGMLAKLNFDNIPNFQNIDEVYRNADYDPANEYTVPYMLCTTGIIYNTTMVDKAPASWADLWDEQYAGNILMFNNSRDAYAIAAFATGHSINPQSTEEVDEVVDHLKAQKPLVQAYVMDEIFDKMIGGEAAIGVYYSGDAITMIDDNPDLAWVFPEEGSVLSVDSMCIPATSEKQEAAEMFINFMCEVDTLLLGFHKTMPTGLSLGGYLQMLAWFVLLCGLVSRLRYKQEALLLLATPLALILFAVSAPYLSAVVQVPPQLKGSFYALHVGALFLSMGLMTLAFAASSLFLFLERRIKSKQRMEGFWQDMPALSLLDKINAFGVAASFPLYTLGVVSGLFWAKPVYGATFTGDPKEVVSIIVWLLMAYVFHGRLATGWRGRKPARLMVLVFGLSLFSIVVVNTLMETHHSFIKP